MELKKFESVVCRQGHGNSYLILGLLSGVAFPLILKDIVFHKAGLVIHTMNNNRVILTAKDSSLLFSPLTPQPDLRFH